MYLKRKEQERNRAKGIYLLEYVSVAGKWKSVLLCHF